MQRKAGGRIGHIFGTVDEKSLQRMLQSDRLCPAMRSVVLWRSCSKDRPGQAQESGNGNLPRCHPGRGGEATSVVPGEAVQLRCPGTNSQAGQHILALAEPQLASAGTPGWDLPRPGNAAVGWLAVQGKGWQGSCHKSSPGLCGVFSGQWWREASSPGPLALP